MLKYVWFDLGYTLVYVNREEKYQQKPQRYGVNISIEELKQGFHVTDKYFMREFPGLLSKKYELYAASYYKALHEYLNLDSELDFKQLTKPADESSPKGRWIAFEDTIPTLQKLREQGVSIGLISNWNHTAREVLKETGIFKYLDHIVISSEVDVEKPNEQIFNIALDEAGVTTEECLYIGDNYYDDAIGSSKVGMKSIIINPYNQLGIEELKNVQVISNIKDLYPAIQSKLLLV
ncbi:HAD family hydrolase [Oceanobacillus sojae]|uniref:HAD family hydrolase n=1 Tax=Oceanobacillus sojae TaxID=582851 RepID=UPI00098889D5|nr:HAD-IA family hydrolase [Oceanobacillus sojae]